jgi:WD40 repeat protein
MGLPADEYVHLEHGFEEDDVEAEPPADRILHGSGLSVQFPKGDFIVSASYDMTLKVWDASTGKERFTLKGHAERVRSCAVSSDSDVIVSVSHDHTLKVWDAHSGVCLTTLFVDGPLYSRVIHPDCRRIVAGGARGLYYLEFVR